EVDVREGKLRRLRIAVAQRAGVGAGALRSDAQAIAIEATHRSTAGSHGVDAHHGSPNPYSRDLAFVHAIQLAVVAGDIRRRAAHVETDRAAIARGFRHS